MAAIRYEDPPGQPPPVGQYSNVAIVEAGSATAYIAGQLPVNERGAVVAPDDFDRQADLVFARLRQLLESIGSSLREVTFLRVFLVDRDDFPRFRDARRRAFEEAEVHQPPPATTVVVSSLYGGARIELDASAVVPGTGAQSPS